MYVYLLVTNSIVTIVDAPRGSEQDKHGGGTEREKRECQDSLSTETERAEGSQERRRATRDI